MIIRPEYEHLHRATDAGLMQPRFEEEIGRLSGKSVTFKEFYVTRVFPRQRGSFAIQYSGVLNETTREAPKRLLLCGSLLGPSESWPEYALKREGRSFMLEDVRLAVPVFPFDPTLTRLPELYGLDMISLIKGRLMENIKPDSEEVKATDCEILGYRLERRCVLRYTLNNIEEEDPSEKYRVVAKIMRPGRSSGSLQAMIRLASNGFSSGADDGIAVPQIYYSDASLGAIYMENSPGTTLHLLIGKPIFDEACRQAGRLLRKLHTIDTEGLSPYTATDEMESFGRRFETATGLYPRLTGPFEEVVRHLERRLAEIESGYDPVCTHRDFHDKQILCSASRTTLLDCDNLALADPALDYGNFLAHLILRRMQAPEYAEDIGNGTKTFANSYGIADPDFKSRARWWMAASLVRLAALYSLRPRWRSLSPRLLEEADHCLDPMKLIYGGMNAIDSN